MPIYEYICEEDGQRIELLRPIKDADVPVEDPDGKGRTFKRIHSGFAVGKSSASAPAIGPCGHPCGNPDGACGMMG